MTDILIEGGLGGHMPHLYENGDLTFGDLKDIFKQASKGQLKGTEKTDGQNIKLSFNVKTQQALGARNTGQLKEGGLTIKQMFDFFATHKNPQLKYTFSDAVKIFEKAAKLLDVDTQIQIFGPDANNWYNAEVMDDRTPNVVNYDTRNLLIHRTGHIFYNRKTGETQTEGDIDKKSQKFMNFLEKVQKSVSDKRHAILVNPIQNLKALDNKEALRIAYSKLENIISKYNLSDDNTINDFLKAELNKKLKTNLPDELKQIFINSALGVIPKVKKREVKKDLPQEIQAEIDELINAIPQLIKTAIKPIELIVTDFAAEMLKTLESIFILDNKAETARLANEVKAAIEKIQSGGTKGDIEFLNNQLLKLKNVDTISSAVEGFAFSYNGIIYKFTGKFAPVNQILGLSKYGRGKKDSDDKNADQLKEEQKTINKFDVALLGGGFKPPHKGHIELIKQLASKADSVIIYTSARATKQRTFNSGILKGQIIDGVKCIQFLEKMLQQVPELSNVNLIVTDKPLKEIFDYVEKTSKFGDSILIGVGNKDEDKKRFDSILKYAPPEKKLKIQVEALKPIVFNGEPLSATRMREAISNKNLERLISFIPDEIMDKTGFAEEMISTFTGDKAEKSFKEQVFEEVYNMLTNEEKLKEMSAMGAGAVAGHMGADTKRGKKKMKIDRKTFMEELELRKTIRKALILREEKKKANLTDEQKLRGIIKQVISEAKKEFNYGNTGLNVLAKHLVNVIPSLINTYESLQTSPEQRKSFEAHILGNIDDLLRRTEETLSTGQMASGENEEELEEDINLSIDEPVEDKFLDVFGDEEKKAKEKEQKQKQPEFRILPEQDPTGVEFAHEAYKALASQTQEEYKKLRNVEDRKMFKDYMLSNIKSYLEQSEDKISRKADQVNMPQGQQVQQSETEPVQKEEPVV